MYYIHISYIQRDCDVIPYIYTYGSSIILDLYFDRDAEILFKRLGQTARISCSSW